MIDVFDNKKCCGCNACVNACPAKCICTTTDDKGFSYPIVDKEKCIVCNLCEKVCPMLHTGDPAKPISTEGMVNGDESIRLASSSGGIFTAIAKEVISNGGIVYGAAYADGLHVVHTSAVSISALGKFRGSKYLQSDTADCFSEIKNELKTGRLVLFSGTPCQVRGLHLYLQKTYENLITVDFICHGVPSYEVFKAYLEDEKRRMNKTEICFVNFRDKSHAGWHGYCPSLSTRDNSRKPIPIPDSAYMRGFGANLYLRPSCYECPSKNFSSGADITLADYWRVDVLHPELDDNKGTSLVAVLTAKGEEIISKCSEITRMRVNADDAYRYQIALHKSMPFPPASAEFWASDWHSDFINVVNRICSRRTMLQRVVGSLKKALRMFGVKNFLALFSKRFR